MVGSSPTAATNPRPGFLEPLTAARDRAGGPAARDPTRRRVPWGSGARGQNASRRQVAPASAKAAGPLAGGPLAWCRAVDGHHVVDLGRRIRGCHRGHAGQDVRQFRRLGTAETTLAPADHGDDAVESGGSTQSPGLRGRPGGGRPDRDARLPRFRRCRGARAGRWRGPHGSARRRS